MMTALVSWGAAGVYVTGMLGLPTIKFAPVAFACCMALLFDALWGFIKFFIPRATEKEKQKWIQEDRKIAQDGVLAQASQIDDSHP